MAGAWPGGSTTAWRKIRALVLERDGYRCQLQLTGCTRHATQAHHTVDRNAVGDDPAYLLGSCRSCNRKVGDPTKHRDPTPTPRTRW